MPHKSNKLSYDNYSFKHYYEKVILKNDKETIKESFILSVIDIKGSSKIISLSKKDALKFSDWICNRSRLTLNYPYYDIRDDASFKMEDRGVVKIYYEDRKIGRCFYRLTVTLDVKNKIFTQPTLTTFINNLGKSNTFDFKDVIYFSKMIHFVNVIQNKN